MLKSVNAALQRAAQSRTLDQWAGIAADLLGAAAIVVVRQGDVSDILGASPNAAKIPAATLDAAAAIAPTVAGDYPADQLFEGTPLPAAAQFARAITILIRHESARLRVIIFLDQTTVPQPTLERFHTFSERRMAEISLADRYRTDLKRYISMLRDMERTAKIGIWDLDLEARKLSVSDEVRRIFRCPPREPIKLSRALICFPRHARRQLIEAMLKLSEAGEPINLALPIHVPGADDERTVRIFVSRKAAQGNGARRLSGVLQDVTEQHQVTERLWWMTNHDALTELPNRALFADRFHNALERRVRSKQLVSIVLVDVDKFKEVNDSYGHPAGDELLRRIARQLRECVRAQDTVARTGGDEFSILLEDINDLASLQSVMMRLEKALTVRFAWQEHTITTTLSAGVAIAPEHGETEQELIAAADLALYRTKDIRGAALAVYQASFGRAAAARNAMIKAAREALDGGRIVPYYQPQIDIATGRIVGVEALARWVTDEDVLTATDFVDALKDTEIGPLIGRRVVDQAMTDLAALNRNRESKLSLSVNASAGDLLRDRFLERIGERQRDAQSCGPITVEITEDVILDDPDRTLCARMRSAQEAADVTFSLDNFGKGYGSLIHITTMPISEVKIDRSFVAALETDAQKAKMVQGILEMARSLEVRVVVEGVEQPEQAARIAALGGQFVQGYYFSKAVPLDRLVELLAAQDDSTEQAA